MRIDGNLTMIDSVVLVNASVMETSMSVRVSGCISFNGTELHVGGTKYRSRGEIVSFESDCFVSSFRSLNVTDAEDNCSSLEEAQGRGKLAVLLNKDRCSSSRAWIFAIAGGVALLAIGAVGLGYFIYTRKIAWKYVRFAFQSDNEKDHVITL